MFTGIIECTGEILNLLPEKDNLHITVKSPISAELKIDQSVSHNGICLTVIKQDAHTHTVTAIKETLSKTNLGALKQGDKVNLERCLKIGDRLDGHMVQGHVDCTAICTSVNEQNGSWLFSFEYNHAVGFITVEKGSICINGVSLTVVNSGNTTFSVAIIPYTYEHTNFNKLNKGDTVNLEFDIVGKYIAKMLNRQ